MTSEPELPSPCLRCEVGCCGTFTRKPRFDLDKIWQFIRADNLDAADRVIAEILDAIRALVPFPDQGHKRPDLTSRPLRFTLVREYLIAYAPRRKAVVGCRGDARAADERGSFAQQRTSTLEPKTLNLARLQALHRACEYGTRPQPLYLNQPEVIFSPVEGKFPNLAN